MFALRIWTPSCLLRLKFARKTFNATQTHFPSSVGRVRDRISKKRESEIAKKKTNESKSDRRFFRLKVLDCVIWDIFSSILQWALVCLLYGAGLGMMDWKIHWALSFVAWITLHAALNERLMGDSKKERVKWENQICQLRLIDDLCTMHSMHLRLDKVNSTPYKPNTHSSSALMNEFEFIAVNCLLCLCTTISMTWNLIYAPSLICACVIIELSSNYCVDSKAMQFSHLNFQFVDHFLLCERQRTRTRRLRMERLTNMFPFHHWCLSKWPDRKVTVIMSFYVMLSTSSFIAFFKEIHIIARAECRLAIQWKQASSHSRDLFSPLIHIECEWSFCESCFMNENWIV